MITCILAGIHNRRSGLTYCKVTDTYCFYEITLSSQPTCITFYVLQVIVAFLYCLSRVKSGRSDIR